MLLLLLKPNADAAAAAHAEYVLKKTEMRNADAAAADWNADTAAADAECRYPLALNLGPPNF